MDGQGVHEWPNGKKYIGEYRENKKWGKGKMVKEGIVKEGIWNDGQLLME